MVKNLTAEFTKSGHYMEGSSAAITIGGVLRTGNIPHTAVSRMCYFPEMCNFIFQHRCTSGGGDHHDMYDEACLMKQPGRIDHTITVSSQMDLPTGFERNPVRDEHNDSICRQIAGPAPRQS